MYDSLHISQKILARHTENKHWNLELSWCQICRQWRQIWHHDNAGLSLTESVLSFNIIGSLWLLYYPGVDGISAIAHGIVVVIIFASAFAFSKETTKLLLLNINLIFAWPDVFIQGFGIDLLWWMETQ